MGFESKKSALLGLLLLFLSTTVTGQDFNVQSFGAVPDGKTDSSAALQAAWNSTCNAEGQPKMLIPAGNFLIGPVTFTGPCKAPVTVELKGQLLGSTNLSPYGNNWILFIYIDGLTIFGGGVINGQGAAAWPQNACPKKWECKVLPVGLSISFCNNTKISDISSYNPKMFHILIFKSYTVSIDSLRIHSPDESPNTDGIHLGDSSDIKITNTEIGTGDDCISIGAGTVNLEINNVRCGPGHGISVGSLGKRPNETDVTNVKVTDCTLTGTQNGIRIKTWQSSGSALKASNMIFQNIVMHDVQNPIIVDQEYCPYPSCEGQDPSLVQISDVKFINIKGTSQSNDPITFLCSATHPCQGIELNDISFDYTGPKDNHTMGFSCVNAKGTSSNIVNIESSCF